MKIIPLRDACEQAARLLRLALETQDADQTALMAAQADDVLHDALIHHHAKRGRGYAADAMKRRIGAA